MNLSRRIRSSFDRWHRRKLLSKPQWDIAWKLLTDQLIAARKAKDNERVISISTERDFLKHQRFCAICQVPLSRGWRSGQPAVLHCQMHHVQARYYKKAA